jgi:hypothetical protein
MKNALPEKKGSFEEKQLEDNIRDTKTNTKRGKVSKERSEKEEPHEAQVRVVWFKEKCSIEEVPQKSPRESIVRGKRENTVRDDRKRWLVTFVRLTRETNEVKGGTKMRVG